MYYQQQATNNFDVLNYIPKANENRLLRNLRNDHEINNDTPELRNIYRLFKEFI